ncbi:hypothetical protein T06_1690 [Trichinella sp. T6]|nr:hypothetical protein T06_1690 [Trichinella sp. T6]
MKYSSRFNSPSVAPTKIALTCDFFSNISPNTHLYNVRLVPRQTNAYVSNKWPLKLPFTYVNTQ